jgi:hypothetical protein
MELIGDEVTTDEQKMANILDGHPLLKKRITLIVNGYRELVTLYMEDDEKPDPSDVLRSLAKKDNILRRIGIPVLSTAQEWVDMRNS